MRTRRLARIAGPIVGIFLLSFVLNGCLGSDPKRLGNLTSGTTSPREDTTDNFILEFAQRDTLTGGANNRTVAIQGRATTQANLLVNICGTDASRCTCSFFLTTDLSTAIPALTKSINSQINTMSCQIPAAVTDANLANIGFVRITDSTGAINSGQMRVKDQLLLADVIGTLPQGQIRKVSSYTCTRTFLEGSGISAGTIQCVDGMFLGFLAADYSFYLFQQVDNTATNFNQKGTEQFYNAGQGLLCNLQIRRVSCANNTIVKFGLSATQTSKFRVSVFLTSAPEPTGQQAFYGFAAPADSALNCPPGLVRIRPFQAVPSTYTTQPSNFVNTNGLLNDTVLDVETSVPANYTLRRQAPSTTACAAGSCPAPNGGITTEQNITYNVLNPVLCAIPQALLNGI